MNLLREPPSRNALLGIFERHPVRPLLPVLGDPRWKAAMGNPALAAIRDELVGLASAEVEAVLPELTDALYGDYAATGVRVRFESVYFERRRQVGRAAFALLAVPEASRAPGSPLLRSFLTRLEAIFDEVSWCLPAHVPSGNVTGRDPHCLDLFAAETANFLAECLNVFGSVIPVGLQMRIRERLRRDIFENYRDHADDGSLWWVKVSSNWNAVCHQGILGAALAIEDDSELLAALFSTAARHLPRFLDGFGEDGGCVEGPGYWVYGFGWFSLLNEQLETRTGGELSLFAGDPKIGAIARYGPLACLSGQKLVNFADAAGEAVLRPSLLQYLGARLGDRSCVLQAEENYARFRDGGIDVNDQRIDLLFLLRLFLYCPEKLPATGSVRGGELKPDVFFPDLAVWIVRGNDDAGHLWEVAAKGGHNAEHHNHADLGSFIVNVDGVPLLTEIGAPEYTRDFFDLAHRYTNLAARTLGHSLPLINGCEQPEGPLYKSHILQATTGSDSLVFEIDLTGAYPSTAQCERYMRRLTLDKAGGCLTVTDDITLVRPGTVESAFISEGAEVQIASPQQAFLEKGSLRLELMMGGEARWDRVETHGYKHHSGAPASVIRLVARPLAHRERVILDCSIRLASGS